MSRNWGGAPDWFCAKRYEYLSRLNLSAWQYEIQRCAWLAHAEPSQWDERPEVPSYIGTLTVQLVPKGDVTLHRLEKPALIVQLDAPDGVIIKRFKEELANARKAYPAPVRKPGRKSQNAEFTAKQVKTWLTHNIVQLSELDNWRRGLPKQDVPTDADFGRLLFPGYADPSKQIVSARKVLARPSPAFPLFGRKSRLVLCNTLPPIDQIYR
jgi:hypothetical protein